jgi:DNA-binding SARP family transcriptional activator
MAAIKLALLGPLLLSMRGQAVPNFGYNKVAALLAYLAIERRPHSRDALAALLWPESSDEAARRSLRVALTHLRRIIDNQRVELPVLLITRDTIAFNSAASTSVDALEFTALITAVERHSDPLHALCASCAQQLAQAAALYKGHFLADLRLNDSSTFEEWAGLQREQLHRKIVEALNLLLTYHEQHDNYTLAHQYAWRLVELEPWDEAAHRCLMRVLWRRGQSGAALAQYNRCRRILAEEFGITPAIETTALYQSICAPLQLDT